MNKKYIKIIIPFFIIISIILITFLIKNPIVIKEYKTKSYYLKYDSSWNLKEKSEYETRLKHDSNSEINFEIITLEEKYKYSKVDDIVDEILYHIQKQNNEYKLLSKEKTEVTKYKYDGYKTLYENKDNEVLVVIAKKFDKVVIMTYEAKNEYFDILLDSVQNILYNYQILDTKINLTHKLGIETDKIKWNENTELKNKLNKVSTYEIADKNYKVNYSVSEIFKLSSINSTSSYFNLKDLEKGNITLSINIRNMNIYEYMNKNGSFSTLYYDYNNQREEKSGYSDFKETLEKIDNKNYIYKNNYNSKTSLSTFKYEEAIIIYELDYNHIILFKVKATNTTIPEDLIKNIKLNSSKQYSSNVERIEKDNYLIGELKEYKDFNKDKIKKVTIKIPLKYSELDKGLNLYNTRNYAINYNSDKELYDYNIVYDFYLNSKSKIESLKNSQSNYYKKGKYQELKYSNDIVSNGKTFKLYTGGYTNSYYTAATNYKSVEYYVNLKVLIYELDDGSCICIEIKGNNNEISNELLNELTNFDIEVK